jgi:uncharacterized protein YkwD
MLAGLVLASFLVTPGRRGPVATMSPAPARDEQPGRAVLMARGFIRAPLEMRELPLPLASASPLEPVAVPAAEPEGESASAPEVSGEDAAAPVVEPAPEPEVAPEPTPEPPPPAPAPRPQAPRAAAPITNPTTLWAEAHMLELMNSSRLKAGLAPLVMDLGVAGVARAHSVAESQVRYVYHDGPDGSAASRNVPACGTGWYGENTGKIWNDNVDALHIEFMAEPWVPINHRTNIMDPAFRRVGVGAVMGADAMYMTMVFCR